MIDTIKSLIEERKYDIAIRTIQGELKKKFDLTVEEDEKCYKELLGLRIAAASLSGLDDDILNEHAKYLKFHSESTYNVSASSTIKLIQQSIFDTDADAFVNTIHDKLLFQLSDRSASFAFLKKLGKEDIDRQLSSQGDKALGEIYSLQHPDLKAPVSYHIVTYTNNHSLDMRALRDGINTVLHETDVAGLEHVAFTALGFDSLEFAAGPNKAEMQERIADNVAQNIVSYLWKRKNKSPFRVSFLFVVADTFYVLDKAFDRWVTMDKKYFEAIRMMDDQENRLLCECCTRNLPYIEILRKVSRSVMEDSKVLILGETGVGKSFLAELIHMIRHNSTTKYVSVNCALFKPDFLEAELFGYDKGSFTGANEDHPGLIEKAEGGTLFLDEIGYANPVVQQSLLTVLDKGIFRRKGSTVDRKANARFFFGTNQSLEALSDHRLFNEALLERIAERVFTIPPLRERIEDLPLLVEMILNRFKESRKAEISLSENAIEALTKYKWIGNTRQLSSYVQSLCNDALARKRSIVTERDVLGAPPRNLYKRGNDFVKLELRLQKILKTWDGSKGKLIDDVISPMLAKIFLEDLELKKVAARKILGLDGTRGGGNQLDIKCKQYSTLEKLFDKEN
jgi:energy-coupling factor transporter ATP-binding protein EcfA2